MIVGPPMVAFGLVKAIGFGIGCAMVTGWPAANSEAACVTKESGIWLMLGSNCGRCTPCEPAYATSAKNPAGSCRWTSKFHCCTYPYLGSRYGARRTDPADAANAKMLPLLPVVRTIPTRSIGRG